MLNIYRVNSSPPIVFTEWWTILDNNLCGGGGGALASYPAVAHVPFQTVLCWSVLQSENHSKFLEVHTFLAPFESYVRAWGGNKLEVMSHDVRKTHWRRYYAQLSCSFALITGTQSSENAELIYFLRQTEAFSEAKFTIKCSRKQR